MLSRRGFIGSLLGIAIASKLPYVAQAAVVGKPRNKRELVGRLLLCDVEDIKDKYKVALYNREGICFWGPGIKEIETVESEDSIVYDIQCDNIHLYKSITCEGMVFCNPDGMEIRKVSFVAPITGVSGDVFRVNYRLRLGF